MKKSDESKCLTSSSDESDGGIMCRSSDSHQMDNAEKSAEFTSHSNVGHMRYGDFHCLHRCFHVNLLIVLYYYVLLLLVIGIKFDTVVFIRLIYHYQKLFMCFVHVSLGSVTIISNISRKMQ